MRSLPRLVRCVHPELGSDLRMELQRRGIMTCVERFAGCDPAVAFVPILIAFRDESWERRLPHQWQRGERFSIYRRYLTQSNNNPDLHISLSFALLFSLWRRKEWGKWEQESWSTYRNLACITFTFFPPPCLQRPIELKPKGFFHFLPLIPFSPVQPRPLLPYP